MAYRNKVYLAFDGDSDIHYYWLMRAWKQSDRSTISFNDAHDLNTARDTSQEASIKAQLSIRLQNSKAFVLLVGQKTRYLYKFVRWEIEQAIKRDLPIIAVNLNGFRYMDETRCPNILRPELAMHISFNSAILEFALENWVNQHMSLCRQGIKGPYYYKPEVYQRLGL